MSRPMSALAGRGGVGEAEQAQLMPAAGVRSSIEDATWAGVMEASPLLGTLDARQAERLRAAANTFLARTRVVGAHGRQIEPELVVRIAAEACVLTFERSDGQMAYAGVREVIVYPGAFRVAQRWTDEDGIEHERDAELAGEAWEGGPVVLAREDVETPDAGFNVVVHEFAHVLDAGNGRVNGFPPIEDAALAARWTGVFESAWDALSRADHRGRDGPIDVYALEDPAEFFAVSTEAFFTDPEPLREAWPDVYAALRDYYRPGAATRDVVDRT